MKTDDPTERLKRWATDPTTTMVTLQFVVEQVRRSLGPHGGAGLAAATSFGKKEAAAAAICAGVSELSRADSRRARRLAKDLLQFAPPPPPPRVHFE
jgi:hypothetical protein